MKEEKRTALARRIETVVMSILRVVMLSPSSNLLRQRVGVE